MRAADARRSKERKGTQSQEGVTENRGQKMPEKESDCSKIHFSEIQRKYTGKVTFILDITNIMSDVHTIRLIKGLISSIFHLLPARLSQTSLPNRPCPSLVSKLSQL